MGIASFRCTLMLLDFVRESRCYRLLLVGKCFCHPESCNGPRRALDWYSAGSVNRHSAELRSELFSQISDVADWSTRVLVFFRHVFVRHSHSWVGEASFPRRPPKRGAMGD